MILFLITITVRPKQPLVELITKPDREGYFNEGSKFQARCIVRDGRPVANITWLLDNGPAAKRVGQLEVLASPRENGLELFTAIQDIQWDIAAEDNGRRLVCRSHHQTDPDNVPPQEGAYTLLVRCKLIWKRFIFPIPLTNFVFFVFFFLFFAYFWQTRHYVCLKL